MTETQSYTNVLILRIIIPSFSAESTEKCHGKKQSSKISLKAVNNLAMKSFVLAVVDDSFKSYNGMSGN